MPSLDTLVFYKAVIVALWGLAFFTAERWQPAAPWPPGFGRGQWRRGARNAALWALNAVLSPLIVIPVTVWAVAAAPAAGWRPGGLSGAPGLLVDLMVLDLWIYGWHRASHVLPLLWRFHRVHHLDPFLDATSALRFHPGEVLLSAVVRAAVIAALAIPVTSVVVFEALVLMAAIFHHANAALPPRLEAALSRVVVTPSIHWVHHHAVRADTDSNYATILSVWDRLFASRSPTPRRPEMRIGVEGMHEPDLTGLLALPFRQAP